MFTNKPAKCWSYYTTFIASELTTKCYSIQSAEYGTIQSAFSATECYSVLPTECNTILPAHISTDASAIGTTQCVAIWSTQLTTICSTHSAKRGLIYKLHFFHQDWRGG